MVPEPVPVIVGAVSLINILGLSFNLIGFLCCSKAPLLLTSANPGWQNLGHQNAEG